MARRDSSSVSDQAEGHARISWQKGRLRSYGQTPGNGPGTADLEERGALDVQAPFRMISEV
ncbi:hypothetical protein D3C86_2150530 [compost metagenome]